MSDNREQAIDDMRDRLHKIATALAHRDAMSDTCPQPPFLENCTLCGASSRDNCGALAAVDQHFVIAARHALLGFSQ